MNRSAVLALLGLALLPRPAAAQLDPETKTPYPLRVVLHVEAHRGLTEVFQQHLERELGDLLKHSFGRLVRVRVERWQDAGHPVLRLVERRGLQALDGWANPLPGRTHFLLLRLAGDRYEIRSRQYDQPTGLCTGAERRAEVADRRQVARVAAGLVEQDFGVVGTVGPAQGRDFEVTFQGGELGVPLKGRVGVGDVLRVVRITRDKGQEHGTPLDWLLLRVEAEGKDGRVRCRLFHRFPQDTLANGPGVLGYRCLRMAAKQEPVRLRLLDKETGQPVTGVEVQVRRSDFKDGPAEKLVPRSDGLVATGEVYDKAAFVRVMVGTVQKAQLPVLLLDEQTVVCRLGAVADPQAEQRGLLLSRRDYWERRILDGLSVADERVRELNRLEDRSPDVLLARAGADRKALDDDLATLRAMGKELRDTDAKLDLSAGDKLLAALKRRGDALQTYIETVRREAKQSTEVRAKLLEKYARAKLLEEEAEYAQALALYDEILKASPKEANVRADRDRLARAWQLHGPEHEQARKFIYEVWPTLNLKGLQDHLGQARDALKVFEKVGDRLTPRKLLRSSPALVTALKKRVEQLQRLDSEDARAETKRLEELGRSFEALIREAVAFVEKKQ